MPCTPFLAATRRGYDVQPDDRRLVGHHLLELDVELASLLVVERRLGLLEDRLEAGLSYR